MTSPAWTLVDNLTPSRARTATARTLAKAELEEWVVRQAQDLPAERLNRLRDQAKQIAADLGVPERVSAIDDLFGAAQGAQSSHAGSPLLKARASMRDWDSREDRDVRHAHRDLNARAGDEMRALTDVTAAPDPVRSREAPFFEAYFSNFIEGTEFTLDEAVRIVYNREPVQPRTEDSTDVLGTFVIDPADNRHVAATSEEFVEVLIDRHSQIIAARPSKGARTAQAATEPGRNVRICRPAAGRWDAAARLRHSRRVDRPVRPSGVLDVPGVGSPPVQ